MAARKRILWRGAQWSVAPVATVACGRRQRTEWRGWLSLVTSTPGVRARAEMATEHPCKIRVVVEPAGECNLRKGLICHQHQVLGACQATSHDVRNWCHTNAALERAGKIAGAQTRDGGEIAHPDGRIEMGFDVGPDAD